ncbi:unnamed protein product, partial [Vitis vinifera]|uniref:Uncharacterized protein n=1 Tax=Vitis vinifera TaxID=29760 RepID=D7SWQ0_VITVI
MCSTIQLTPIYDQLVHGSKRAETGNTKKSKLVQRGYIIGLKSIIKTSTVIYKQKTPTYFPASTLINEQIHHHIQSSDHNGNNVIGVCCFVLGA